ncbi:peptide chain release factor N(5)-glutamine methyltransferase [Ectothiorhodospira lacustris]|uniref:peptide chain release factor N(5)-glutamine methyltransferase n=1 Tax=Ectothiorhodospira lacustris TaxID=2899127 RepID=UPI001EE86DA8|nr:peptide chain release factor N(5)-glutamine methyltransferase [Ectothiorhodospira lacustris]MCG5499926.1 peptide chain release factor N(5)-glutamine methyltransferase [Ectothiorhodospira lacustris]MCG5508845.1 peptide chain release factor N(5)-glutamine methyltransferase [Ectothiorhodospira lacustris]MCG5520636.1 peptide chain release factor N(5)-glutamine methyltransferase [Ectothiorhodospira lacustris]
MPALTLKTLLIEARTALAHGEAPRLEAELLLAHALGRDRGWLYAHGGDTLEDPTALACFRTLVQRRAQGEPVSYLLGCREFWSLNLQVRPGVLIPRPDTETLVEAALSRLPQDLPGRVADLGTGTGAIALALAVERPRCRIIAVDRSPQALAVAIENVERLGLGQQVTCRCGDWFEPLAGERFDLIVSNPPYIAEADPHLEQGDLRFEPRSALASGPDGLADIRRIVGQAPDHLDPGGGLLLEHGMGQGKAVRELLVQGGFCGVETVQDLGGKDRVTLGIMPL